LRVQGDENASEQQRDHYDYDGQLYQSEAAVLCGHR